MDAPPVQYITTSDGYNLAYTVSGSGKPLVFPSPNFSSVQTVWQHYPDWMQGLAARFRLVSYDGRMEGLSTRGLPDDVTIEDFGRDVAEIIERLELERPILFVRGSRGHDAVRYSSAFPSRVGALIWNTANISATASFKAFFLELARENWDLFLASLARGLPPEKQQPRINEYRSCITQTDWNRWTDIYVHSTVEAELPHLKTPTLILHPADYPTLPQTESMKVAALIPRARFVSTTGTSLFGDANSGLAAIDAFLADLPKIASVSGQPAHGLSPREVEVLCLVTAGKSNQQIADDLVISLNTANRHVSNIYAKTGAANRAQATAYAKDHGIA
jgi:DNA-binding CsgD family transcriptional regulator/pimeloyl-ACP methyl ester carboxylesterase